MGSRFPNSLTSALPKNFKFPQSTWRNDKAHSKVKFQVAKARSQTGWCKMHIIKANLILFKLHDSARIYQNQPGFKSLYPRIANIQKLRDFRGFVFNAQIISPAVGEITEAIIQFWKALVSLTTCRPVSGPPVCRRAYSRYFISPMKLTIVVDQSCKLFPGFSSSSQRTYFKIGAAQVSYSL